MIIIWTKSAVINLESIKNYIAQDSEQYAFEFIERIIYAVEKLKDYPRLGREVPEAKRDDIRELFCGNYRIMYIINQETLHILSVIHGARDLTKIQPKPWDFS